jgi:hypothetical protein
MITNPLQHFAQFDYFDSELMGFNYDKLNQQLSLNTLYIFDKINAVLHQEINPDFDDVHTYLFKNISGFRRKNVALFLKKKNEINTINDQISINLDTISIKKMGDFFKIKIAFLDGFGDAYFQCEGIDFEQKNVHLDA